MDFHDASNELPMLTPDRHKELVSDIKKNGLKQPILLCDGKIIDGRNRYKACLEAGIEPRYETYSGGDPYAFVWSLNGQRRDLTSDQRYLVWKSLHEKSEEWQKKQQAIHDEANRKRSEATKQQHEVSNPRSGESSGSGTSSSTTREHATRAAKAEASKTNRGSVERMDRLSTKRPDLAEKVKTGEMRGAEALRVMKREEVSQNIQDLPQGKYRVIYADPPWKYGDSRHNLDTATGAEHHYPTMTISELCALPVKDMAADNSVLFLWATSPLLEEAFKVINAWGFKYKASFVWNKLKHNLGHYNSVRHEFLLMATIGSCLPDVSKLHNSVVEIEREQHSRKPEYFRELIDSLYTQGSRIELFRRGDTPSGWAVWGNETAA